MNSIPAAHPPAWGALRMLTLTGAAVVAWLTLCAADHAHADQPDPAGHPKPGLVGQLVGGIGSGVQDLLGGLLGGANPPPAGQQPVSEPAAPPAPPAEPAPPQPAPPGTAADETVNQPAAGPQPDGTPAAPQPRPPAPDKAAPIRDTIGTVTANLAERAVTSALRATGRILGPYLADVDTALAPATRLLAPVLAAARCLLDPVMAIVDPVVAPVVNVLRPVLPLPDTLAPIVDVLAPPPPGGADVDVPDGVDDGLPADPEPILPSSPDTPHGPPGRPGPSIPATHPALITAGAGNGHSTMTATDSVIHITDNASDQQPTDQPNPQNRAVQHGDGHAGALKGVPAGIIECEIKSCPRQRAHDLHADGRTVEITPGPA